MSGPISKAQLTMLTEMHVGTTPGEWAWDSYDTILASVAKGHPLDISAEDEPGIAYLAGVFGGMNARGDELQLPEARANAAFIPEAHNLLPAIVARLELAIGAAIARRDCDDHYLSCRSCQDRDSIGCEEYFGLIGRANDLNKLALEGWE